MVRKSINSSLSVRLISFSFADAIHNFHPQYRDYTQYNAQVRFSPFVRSELMEIDLSVSGYSFGYRTALCDTSATSGIKRSLVFVSLN